jgi:hypothetical protein
VTACTPLALRVKARVRGFHLDDPRKACCACFQKACGSRRAAPPGVGIFNWHHLNSPPQIIRVPVVPLELG